MSEAEIRNARIKSTMLGTEDHGLLTFMIHLDYGGAGQGAGGITLDGYSRETESRYGWGPGLILIRRILEIAEVDSWEKLPGKNIRVRASWAKVEAIGHLLRDDWLDFDAFCKANRP